MFPYGVRSSGLSIAADAGRALANAACPLLEEARRDGDLDFTETKITALAACSLPGFLYSWYRPDGRLSSDELVAELGKLAARVLGLRVTRA